jgi:hypothetical protein
MIGDIIEVQGQKYIEVLDKSNRGCDDCDFNVGTWDMNCKVPKDNDNCINNTSHWEKV